MITTSQFDKRKRPSFASLLQCWQERLSEVRNIRDVGLFGDPPSLGYTTTAQPEISIGRMQSCIQCGEDKRE